MNNNYKNDDNLTTKDCLSGELVDIRRGVKLKVSYHQGQKPAIVFLHGGLGNRFNWRSQYEFFVAQGREVLAYDLGGHGQSSHYDRYSIRRHRGDLTRLLQHYQIKNPILCCHSYGVPLGLEWAKYNYACGLILIAGGTHDLDPWWEIPLIKFLAIGGRHLYHFPKVQSFTNRLSSQLEHSQIKRFFAESPIPKKIHPYKALETFWGYNFWQRHGYLNQNIPVLVISGGKDLCFTKQMGEELAHSFTKAKHLHLPEAGHLLIAEYPETVNQEISNFIFKAIAK